MQLGVGAGKAEPVALFLPGEDGKIPHDDPSVVAFAVLEPDLGIDAEDIAEGVLFPSELPGDVSTNDLNAEALEFPGGHGDRAGVGCLCGIHGRAAVAKVEEVPSSRAWLHGSTIDPEDAEIVCDRRIEASLGRFGFERGFAPLHDIHENGKHRVAVSEGQVIKRGPSQVGLEPFRVAGG